MIFHNKIAKRLDCLLPHPLLCLLLGKFNSFDGRFSVDTDIAVECK